MKHSKLNGFFTAGLIFAAVSAQVSAQELDAQTQEKGFKLIEATDQALAYHGDYSATISLVIEKPGKPKENLQYKIFERVDDDMMTMVQLFPEADKGNGYLMDGDNLWAYDPISRKFTHTSIKEALGDSDVKIDDVNQSEDHWRENYKVSAFEESTLGKYQVYVITLEAITTEPSYSKVKYYVRKDLNLVLKEEDFSGSGRFQTAV